MADDDKARSETEPSKVFDISKPTKSSATSGKPMIEHRPVLRDPSETTDEDEGDQRGEVDKDPTKNLQAASKIKIQPIHDDIVPGSDAVDEEKAEHKPAEASADEPVAADTAEPTPDESKNTDDTTKSTDDDVAPKSFNGVDDEDEPKSTDTSGGESNKAAQEKIDEMAARKAAEHTAEIQKLALSHKYYLPINQVEKRHNKHVAWMGAVVVVLLIAAWGDIALDAGIVSIPGVKAPTHFFGGKQPEAVVAVVAPTTKLYVSSVDKASFSYPADWRVQKTSGGNELTDISPADSDLAVNNPITAITFAHDFTPTTSTQSDATDPQFQATAVTYTKLPATTYPGMTLYLREMTVQETQIINNATKVTYTPYLNITDDQLIKSGDPIYNLSNLLYESFPSRNGSSHITFQASMIVADSITDGPTTSVQDVQNFVKTDTVYRQLKTMMLSLKLPVQTPKP